MDDKCGDWVECIGVASGSGWNLWVWLACGCGWNLLVWLVGVVENRYIDFFTILNPIPPVYVLFCSSIPTFCSTYVLNDFPHSINDIWQLRASHGSHMKGCT